MAHFGSLVCGDRAHANAALPYQPRTQPQFRCSDLSECVVIPRSDLWVATLEGRVAGVLALDGSEIDRLYVAPEAQNRGLGTALVQHAQRLHPAGLRLVTLQRNTGARRLYERHGFEARRYGTSPAPENEPDVEYEWRGADAQH